jgi:hypothetical protein
LVAATIKHGKRIASYRIFITCSKIKIHTGYIALKAGAGSKTVPVYPETALALTPFKVVIDAVVTLPCGKLERMPFTFPSVGGIKCIRYHWCCRIKSRLWNYVLSIVAIALN